MKAVEDRKKEQERREERKIQKEREAEGEKFADKDAYVTSAYKKKLEEQKEELEREKREAALEGWKDRYLIIRLEHKRVSYTFHAASDQNGILFDFINVFHFYQLQFKKTANYQFSCTKTHVDNCVCVVVKNAN